MHELDCPDVETARRLRGDQDPRVPRHLARDDDLLLVAAGERGCAGLRSASAYVVLLQQSPRVRDHATRIQPAESRERRLVVVVQSEVFREGELEHEAAAVAVLGYVAESLFQPRVRAGGGEIAPADDHST